MKYSVVLWVAAAIYLAIGVCGMHRKTSMRLSFISQTPIEKISDVSAYNKEIGKMWCVMAFVLLIGGAAIRVNPAFSILLFAIVSTVGVGGIAWWQSKIEKSI